MLWNIYSEGITFYRDLTVVSCLGGCFETAAKIREAPSTPLHAWWSRMSARRLTKTEEAPSKRCRERVVHLHSHLPRACSPASTARYMTRRATATRFGYARSWIFFVQTLWALADEPVFFATNQGSWLTFCNTDCSMQQQLQHRLITDWLQISSFRWKPSRASTSSRYKISEHTAAGAGRITLISRNTRPHSDVLWGYRITMGHLNT
jgi:hypothetical protein